MRQSPAEGTGVKHRGGKLTLPVRHVILRPGAIESNPPEQAEPVRPPGHIDPGWLRGPSVPEGKEAHDEIAGGDA